MTTPNNTVAGLAEKVREIITLLRQPEPDNGEKYTEFDEGYDQASSEIATMLEAALASPAPSAPPSVAGDAGELPEYVTYEDASEAVKRAYRYGTTGDGFSGPLTWLHDRIRRLATAEQPAKPINGFKEYVHMRLDAMGVPGDPESTHKAAGCRIGGRLDWIEQRIADQPGSAVQGEAVAWQCRRRNTATGEWTEWMECAPELEAEYNATPGEVAVMQFRTLYTTPPPAPDPAEQFCDGHCTWSDHHPDCVRAAPAAEQGAIVADVAKEAGVKVGEVLTFLHRALAMDATVSQRISHDIAGCVVEHFRAQPEARGVEGMVPADPWRPINELDPSDDLFWFLRWDGRSAWVVDGPRKPQHGGYDADEWDWFAPAEAPPAATPNPVRAEQPEGKEATASQALHSVLSYIAYRACDESGLPAGLFATVKAKLDGMLAPAAPGAAVGVDEAMLMRACNAYFDALPVDGGVAADRNAMRAALTAALAGKDGA